MSPPTGGELSRFRVSTMGTDSAPAQRGERREEKEEVSSGQRKENETEEE